MRNTHCDDVRFLTGGNTDDVDDDDEVGCDGRLDFVNRK